VTLALTVTPRLSGDCDTGGGPGPAGPHWHHDAAGSVLRLRVSPGLAATAALKLSLAAALLAPVPELSEARNLKFGPTLPSRWQVALQWIGTRITELA